MRKSEKAPELVEQPLMSTGTGEPGFQWDAKKPSPESKPKIGGTIIGDDGLPSGN